MRKRMTNKAATKAISHILTTRHAPADQRRDMVGRDISLRAQTVDREARTVEVTIATEARALVFDYRTWEVIEEVLLVEGMRHGPQVPLLADHNRFNIDAIRGSIRNIRTEGGELIGVAHFADDDDSARAWNKVQAGHLTDISAGYRNIKWEMIAAGESRVIKGKTYRASEDRSLRVVTESELKEGSLVPIGADSKSTVREDQASMSGRSDKEKDMSFEKWLQERGLKLEDLNEAQRAALRKDFEEFLARSAAPAPATQPAPQATGTAPAPAPASTTPTDEVEAARAAAMEEGRRAEVQRRRRIHEIAGSETPAELVNRALDEGWDEARASLEFLAHFRQNRGAAVPSGVSIHSRNHDRDCNREALAAAMRLRAGIQPVGEQQAQQAERGDRYRDMAMLDLCREACRLDGQDVPHSRDGIIHRAVSGSTLTNIFTQTVGAVLLREYTEAPDTTRGWVTESDVPDFKAQERKRVSEADDLTKLARGGEADHDSLEDEGTTLKVARYAKQFSADEQDIIDDNFGVLVTHPRRMGIAAARLRPDLVYAILLGNPTYHDSLALFEENTHNNLTGSVALGHSNLETVIQKMLLQRGLKDKAILNLMPRYLIVPPALKFTAERILTSAETRNTNSNTKEGTRNVMADQGISPIVEARLEHGVVDPDSGETKSGSTGHYFLSASPGQVDTIEVAYLRGTGRRPTVRSWPMTQGRWGIGFDIKHDIGVKALDFRGLAKGQSAGL